MSNGCNGGGSGVGSEEYDNGGYGESMEDFSPGFDFSNFK